MNSHAAKVEKVCSYIRQKTTFYRDITGDGKSDTIMVKPQIDQYNKHVIGVQVYINGKKVLDQSTNMALGICVNYFSTTKTRPFLQISTHVDSTYRGYNKIFRSNSKGTKLICALDLADYAIYGGEVVSTSSKQIKVAFSDATSEVGEINWKFIFNYKNNKFKLKSNIATVKSLLADCDKGDGYNKYFKQNKFKTQKALVFYQNNLKSVAFTAKKGSVLKLRKIKVDNHEIYLQFQLGSKKGWKQLNDELNWFYGVTSRLSRY